MAALTCVHLSGIAEMNGNANELLAAFRLTVKSLRIEDRLTGGMAVPLLWFQALRSRPFYVPLLVSDFK